MKMKNVMRIALSGLFACAAAGCAVSMSYPTYPLEEDPGPDPREADKARIDQYISNYVQPELEIPTVYAPEWKGDDIYDKTAAVVKEKYQAIPVLAQSAKLKSLNLVYKSDKNKTFTLDLVKESSKVAILCRDEAKKADTFKLEAELPEIKVMPKSIPANMEDTISRELAMIQAFFMDSTKMPKSVSFDIVKMPDTTTKQIIPETKEFFVDERFCTKAEILLRDMFGGGMIRMYVAADSTREIIRLDIPSLALAGDAAFSLHLSDYFTTPEMIVLPKTVKFGGETYTLVSHKADVILPPAPPAAADAAKQDDKAADASAETKEEEAAEEDVASEDAEEDTDDDADDDDDEDTNEDLEEDEDSDEE